MNTQFTNLRDESNVLQPREVENDEMCQYALLDNEKFPTGNKEDYYYIVVNTNDREEAERQVAEAFGSVDDDTLNWVAIFDNPIEMGWYCRRHGITAIAASGDVLTMWEDYEAF